MSDRTMPWDEDAEISVLGALLIDADAGPKVFEVLTDVDFYAERHRRIFRSCQRLFDKGQPCDPYLVQAELETLGELESVGGREFLADLLDAVPTAGNVSYHAGVVSDRAKRRRIITAGGEVVLLGHERDGRSADELLDAAMQCVYSAAGSETRGLVTVRQAMRPAFDMIEQYSNAKGGITGVPTGLYDLDEATGGWQKGNLVVIAARPSMGKTALAVGCALHASISAQVPTAIFSLEMSKEEIVQRALCYEGLVDLGSLLRGRLSQDDYVRIAQAAGHVNAAQLWIDDSAAMTVMQVRAKARRLKAEKPDLGLIVVDYMQLMTADGENRTQEVSAISRGLKSLAKELHVPVIALSQLSRGPESRANKRPMLSDLRESGAIEQDADLVAFLYRPEKYDGQTDSKGNDLRGKAELIISKQRNGPTPTIELYFRDYCCRFESMERRMKLA